MNEFSQPRSEGAIDPSFADGKPWAPLSWVTQLLNANLDLRMEYVCQAPPGFHCKCLYCFLLQQARYKQSLDPTVDEVKKLCTSLRRNAKEERVLFHYNGHGVPRPTVNGEIWVFNKVRAPSGHAVRPPAVPYRPFCSILQQLLVPDHFSSFYH